MCGRLLNNAAVLLRRKNVIDMPVRHVTIRKQSSLATTAGLSLSLCACPVRLWPPPELLASSLERLQEDLQWVFVQRIAAQLLHHILVIYLKGLIK